MRKKGQVTIFIIIAVIIIAAVILFFVLRGGSNVDNNSSEIAPINTHVLSCLEETSEKGLDYLALHGGYYKVPEKISILYFTEDIPYYYLDSKEYVPRIEVVEEELEYYIQENLERCISFYDFEEQGFEINQGDLSVFTDIKEEGINIKVDYLLTIKKGKDANKLRKFEIEIDSNLKKLLEASEEIVASYSENPEYICLTCLEEISNNYDIEIKTTSVEDVSVFENNIMWFSIIDKEDDSIDKLTLVFIVET